MPLSKNYLIAIIGPPISLGHWTRLRFLCVFQERAGNFGISLDFRIGFGYFVVIVND
ncbi:hypothetical protein KFK09_001445 [Dendrobium nobile]|uniref:Uncharacterized protein n=1 Tax=Dendrobium nobile TaxID=94219 RepID=A0A8T3CAC6_DENNO|nr:hypothetical protein KFK09_001445 [Dendrobium nobile]